MTDPIWLNYLHPALLCGLCGNIGIVDTRGHVHSNAGVECGVRTYCLCPTGEELRKREIDMDEWLTIQGRHP